MHRKLSNNILGGVLSGIADTLCRSTGFLRVFLYYIFLDVGGLTLGIWAGAMTIIYILLWMFLPGR